MLREEFDDWAVLFDDAGNSFGLNPTGIKVWQFLDGKCSIYDILKALHRDAEELPQEAASNSPPMETGTLHFMRT